MKLPSAPEWPSLRITPSFTATTGEPSDAASGAMALAAFSALTRFTKSVTCAFFEQAGLGVDRAQGRNVFYRAEPRGLAPLFDWMSHYGLFWRDRLTDLRTLLKEIDP